MSFATLVEFGEKLYKAEEEGGRLLLEYDFSGARLSKLQAIQMSGAALSFVASSFVVVSFLRFESLRSRFAFELVANVALSDVGASVSAFLGAPRDGGSLCLTQAVLGQFFELASVFWATAIATTLYLSIRKKEALSVDRWRPRVYVFCYGVSGALALLPLTTSSYGSAGAWCWIKAEPRVRSNAWRFSVFYVPCWLCIIFDARVYASCAFVLHRLSTVVDTQAADQLKRTVRRLIRYPGILVLCWVFPTINRIQQSINGEPVFALYVLTVLSLSLVGFFNALAFGATDQVKAEWKKQLATTRCCCCETKKRSAFAHTSDVVSSSDEVRQGETGGIAATIGGSRSGSFQMSNIKGGHHHRAPNDDDPLDDGSFDDVRLEEAAV